MMDTRRHSMTRKDIAVKLPMLFVLMLCLNAVFCDIFCPPAVENAAYNITAETYNMDTDDLHLVSATWFYGTTTFAICNFTALICTSTSPLIDNSNIWYQIMPFGHNDLQMIVGTPSFGPILQERYSVMWTIGQTTLNETCTVAIGNPIDECSLLNPCVHATGCIDETVGYRCLCSPGYSGQNCKEGDLRLRCGNNLILIGFPQGSSQCGTVNQNCSVAGLEDNADIGLNYWLISNNESSVLQVTQLISDKTFSITVCTSSTTPSGLYQIFYELTSNLSVSSFEMQVTADVRASNTPPEFNEASYVINVPEDTPLGTIIATVYKSTTSSCNDTSCIQVIDSDVNPSYGISSLSLSVTLENQKTASILYQSANSIDSLGYFFLSGQLTPSTTISYSMLAADGQKDFDTANVIFNITDVNEPPVCNTSAITADLDIRSQPDRNIGAVSCTDNDVDPTYRKVVYSITGQYSNYFSVRDDGTIVMYQAVNGLQPGILYFDVTATGYSDASSSAYVFNIPVYINLTVPELKCNLTISSVPMFWSTNSEAELKLECETWGNESLADLSWNYIDNFTVDFTFESFTIYKIKLTLKEYKPAVINFEVIVTLGIRVSTAAVVLQMYNAPQFNVNNYAVTIPDTIQVGESFLLLNATSDIPGAILTYRIKSGDDSSFFMLDSNGFLSAAKQLNPDEVILLVCEVQDSISLLTTTAIVNVIVIDINEPPVCSNPGPLMINSSLPPGSVITTISCSDADVKPEYRILSYTIHYDSSEVQMEIRNNGDIVLVAGLPAGITSIMVFVNVSDIDLSTLVQFNITVIVIKCSSETTQFGLSFPETPVNSEITINCPDMHSGQVSRSCYLNKTWGSFNYNNCSSKSLENITNMLADLNANISFLSPEEVSDKLKTVADNLARSVNLSSTVLSGDITRIVQIFSTVGDITTLLETASLDVETVQNFASAADVLFGADDNMWQESSKNYEVGAMMLDAMDNIVKAGLRDNQSVNEVLFVRKHLEMIKATTRDDITFSSTEKTSYGSQIVHPVNSALLPKKAFQNIKDEITYTVINYKNITDKLKINQTLQQGSLRGKVLNSNVLTFAINANIATLSPPLQLSFSFVQAKYSNASCGYLDTSASVPGVWATEGCTTMNLGDTVKCSCSHLTNFAVLMSPYGEISADDKKILSIISGIGCGISIFCLALTIIVYKCLWKYVKCDRSVLHVLLSMCLILAYIAFLAGVDRTDNEIGCKVVAALLHYLFLVVFFIMLSEGIEIFKSVSFVFSAESILCKLVSLSFGAPVIVVAVSLGVTKTEGYGDSNSCWLSTTGGLIWAFVGPVLLVILINFIILIKVLIIMQRSKKMMSKTARDRAKSVVRAIAVLSPLLGITWVFGVLSVNRDTIVFQYLFAIFNSLQGLFIFICYCLLTPQVRDGFRASRRKHRAQSFDSSKKIDSSSFSDYKTRLNKGMTNYDRDSNTPTTYLHDSTSSDYTNNSGNYQRQDSSSSNNTHTRKKEDGSYHPARNDHGHMIPLANPHPANRHTIPAHDDMPMRYPAVFNNSYGSPAMAVVNHGYHNDFPSSPKSETKMS